MLEPNKFAWEQPSLSSKLRRQLRRVRGRDRWKVAQAVVLACDWVIHSGSDGDVGSYDIQFVYRVDQETYYGGFSLPGYGTARLFAPGDYIEIRFDPHKPSHSLYEEAWTDNELWSIVIVILAVIFLAHWLITGHAWFHSSSE
jgi:hypothetical protein